MGELEKGILKMVENETGKSLNDLRKKDRSHKFVMARMMFAYIGRMKGFSFPALGEIIDRDHTTVINLFKKAEKLEYIRGIFIKNSGENKSVTEKVGTKNKSRYRYLYELYGGKCAVCGFDEVLEVHHIIPRYIGGGEQLSNLIILCPNHHALADRGMLKIKDMHIKK